MIVLQQPTEPFATPERRVAASGGDGWEEEQVVASLVIAFVMVMRHELVHRPSERALADQDHPVQARFLDGPYEALSERIQIGGSRRQAHSFDAGCRQRLAKRLTEQRVPIVQQEPLPA